MSVRSFFTEDCGGSASSRRCNNASAMARCCGLEVETSTDINKWLVITSNLLIDDAITTAMTMTTTATMMTWRLNCYLYINQSSAFALRLHKCETGGSCTVCCCLPLVSNVHLQASTSYRGSGVCVCACTMPSEEGSNSIKWFICSTPILIDISKRKITAILHDSLY